MAISIHQQPQLFTPAGNDMTYAVSSTNIAQTNFKYIFDVYINGSFVTRELRSQHPTYGTGVMDIKKLVSPSITSDFSITNTNGIVKNTNSFVTVQVKCGEQFGPSSGITNFLNLTNSDTIYAFAGSIKTLDFVDWDYTDYYGSAQHTGLFLTNRSRTKHYIKQSQNDWLSAYTNSSGNLYTVVGETFDYNGNSIQNFDFTSPYQALSNTDDRFIKFASGWNLNDITTLNSGTQPILSAGVKYFIMQITDVASGAATELITTYIEQSCNWGTEYDLHFQNALGFQETFRFTKWTTKTEEYDRRNFKKPTGTYGTNSFTVSKSDRGWETYHSKTANRWILRSDWINDEMIPWIGELISTKQAYIDINGELIPVIIENTNYEQITKQTNQLRNLELTVRLPDDYR